MPQSGRRTALIAGLTTVVVLGAIVAFFRRDILVQYYLLRLRREPAFFEEALASGSDPAKWAALRAHLRTPEGRTAYMDAFIAEFLESQGHRTSRSSEPPPSHYLRTRDFNTVKLATIGLRTEPHLYWWDFRWENENKVWGLSTAATPALRAAPEVLGELVHCDILLSKYDRLRCRVLPVDDCPILQGSKKELVSKPGSIFFGARLHVCVLEQRE